MKTVSLSIALIAAALALQINAGETPTGKDVFERRCSGCHSLDQEKEGPRLRRVYGRTAGSVPTFTYSDAIKKSRITWDTASLDRWLTDPESLVPETDMAFRLTKPEERQAIITYLKQLSLN